MLDPESTTIIVNPRAAGGRVGSRWADIAALLARELRGARVVATERAGHGVDLARAAVESGSTTVLSLGGDGTHNEVVNGIMCAGPGARDVALGILPAGTGGDFRRLLASGSDLERSLGGLSRAPEAAIDVGSVRFLAAGGRITQRYFLNVTSFGIGGLVDRLVNESSKALGGKASFLLGTLRAMARYRPARVRLWVDDHEAGEYAITNICVCNGRFAGGGMMFAPEARLGDGLFDVIVFKDAPLLAQLCLSRKIYAGTHVRSPLVDTFRGASVRAETLTEDPAYVDVDGEAPGVLPVEITLHPRALSLLDPRPHVV